MRRIWVLVPFVCVWCSENWVKGMGMGESGREAGARMEGGGWGERAGAARRAEAGRNGEAGMSQSHTPPAPPASFPHSFARPRRQSSPDLSSLSPHPLHILPIIFVSPLSSNPPSRPRSGPSSFPAVHPSISVPNHTCLPRALRVLGVAQLTFSTRLSGSNPRSLLSPKRMLSPSSLKLCSPRWRRACSSAVAIVLFPDAERPVNQMVAPPWPKSWARSSRVTAPAG